MVASQQGILAVGGYEHDVSYRSYRQEIYILRCDDPMNPNANCKWETMTNGLRIGRAGHTVIPLPNSGSVDYSRICDCTENESSCISCRNGFFPLWRDARIGCHACKCDTCTKSSTGDLCNCLPGYNGTNCNQCSDEFNFDSADFPNCQSKPGKINEMSFFQTQAKT